MKSINGKLLHIDLTSRTCEIIAITDEVFKKYIGGRSLGAKLLVDYVQPNMDPFDPLCPFFVLTGPTTGTIVPSSGKYVIVGKSPLTGAYFDSYASGYIAPELKYAGWDGLMITGKASEPCYLWIRDDEVEFRDARHLWGMNTFDSEDAIRDETDSRAGTCVIGVAGEKLSPLAVVNSDHYRQAARGGGGALFGSKNLKGIAVLGSKGIDIADMDSLYKYNNEITRMSEESITAQSRKKYGTPLTMNITNKVNMLPTNNFQESHSEEAIGMIDADGCEKMTIKTRGCWGCLLGCSKITKVPENEKQYAGEMVEGPEYETTSLLGSNLGITYLPSIITTNKLCDEYGIDTISASGVIAFVMECVQHGYLTDEDVEIDNVMFGNYDVVPELLRRMAYRKGFGDLMAQGVYSLSQYVGRDSYRFAMHSKKMEFPGYEPRAGFGVCLAYAVNPRGACHRKAWPPTLEVLKGYPPYTTENKGKLIYNLTNEKNILHSVLVCDFACKFVPFAADEAYSKFLTYITGETWTKKELQEGADRGENMTRLFNYREGFSRDDDSLPDRVFDETTPQRYEEHERVTREDLEFMKNEYYNERGWDESGCPTVQSLRDLGMEEYIDLAIQCCAQKGDE